MATDKKSFWDTCCSTSTSEKPITVEEILSANQKLKDYCESVKIKKRILVLSKEDIEQVKQKVEFTTEAMPKLGSIELLTPEEVMVRAVKGFLRKPLKTTVRGDFSSALQEGFE